MNWRPIEKTCRTRAALRGRPLATMPKKGPPRCCLPCCAAATIFLSTLLIVVGEVVLPNLVLSGVHSSLKQDTQASINEWLEDYDDPKWKDGDATDMTFFNLTNAYELQTVTPAPKPHFDAITIPMIQKTLEFDGAPLNAQSSKRACCSLASACQTRRAHVASTCAHPIVLSIRVK